MSAAPFTVDVRNAYGLAEIVASLPHSLVPTDGSAGQLAPITGSAGWTARATAALSLGALAVVVNSPAAEDAECSDDRVVLEWPFASNPGLIAAAEAAEAYRGRAVLGEVSLAVQAGIDLDTALLDALTAASRVFGDFAPIETLHCDAAGWHFASRLACGAPLTVSIVVSDAAPSVLRLRLLTGDGGLTAVVPSPDRAAPAEVRIVGLDDERLLPTLWETSRRASWRRAVAIASGDSVHTAADSSDVAELHRITSLIATDPR